jgi:predicted PurR-regulated permease PerM
MADDSGDKREAGARGQLHRWLPHIILLLLVAATLLLLATVLAPLQAPILLAAALAALTHPVLFEPMDARIGRWFPKLAESTRRQLAGIVATVLLALLLISPILALILNTVGSLEGAIDLTIGLLQRDRERMAALFDAVESQTTQLKALYPGMPVTPEQISEWLESLLVEATDFGPAFLGFLFRGTGSLFGQLVLCLVILPTAFARGGQAARFLLHFTPLDDRRIQALSDKHRAIVLRLLNETVVNALANGVVLGLLGWFFTGLPFLLITLFATFLSLVPIIGTTMVWLPLVVLLWSQQQTVAAISLAVLAVAATYGLGWLHSRISRRIDDSGSWLGFLLFIGLVGGLLAYGLRGFVIGPMVVVLAILVFGHLLPYYGVGDEEVVDDSADGDTVPPKHAEG